jgi:hypothetical protein
MNCETPAQCADSTVGLPATMVSYAHGMRMKAAVAAGGATVRFTTTTTRGTDFGLDASGALVQTWGGSGAGAGVSIRRLQPTRCRALC